MEKQRKTAAILELIQRFIDEYGYNPLDNYAYREDAVINVLNDKVDSTIKKLTGRHGADATNDAGHQIEIKSARCRVNRRGLVTESAMGTWQFDKQNDPIRRAETLAYDMIVFASFFKMEPTPRFVALVGKDDVQQFNEDVLRKKQDEFLKKMEECARIGKRLSRDTIDIRYKDFGHLPYVKVVIDNTGR